MEKINNSKASCFELKRLIEKPLQIQLKDTRELTGILTAIDRFGNILMSCTNEKSVDSINPQKYHVRKLGLVSVPRKQVSEVRISKSEV